MLNDIIKKCINKSVLCWLATVNQHNEPNVSPKEMFTYQDNKTLLIAHLASPNSVANILHNANVCVSFVDIFVQKGFKIKGTATLISKPEREFQNVVQPLIKLFSDTFPIQAVIVIDIKTIETIQAPSYWLYPNTTEQNQIANAMKTYGVQAIPKA